MKKNKDEQIKPKHEESFAYSEGIGDPDRAWEQEMKIEDKPQTGNTSHVVDSYQTKDQPLNHQYDDRRDTYGASSQNQSRASSKTMKRPLNDADEILGDDENTNHVVEGHERFISDPDPLEAEKPFDLDPNLRDVDKF